jgi:hypothetical protein
LLAIFLNLQARLCRRDVAELLAADDARKYQTHKRLSCSSSQGLPSFRSIIAQSAGKTEANKTLSKRPNHENQ